MLSHRRPVMLFVLCTSILYARSVKADPTRDACSAIQAIYNRQARASAKKDPRVVTSTYTPDFVSIETNGTRTDASESRASIDKLFTLLHTIKIGQTVEFLTLKGNEALVHAKSHVEATMLDARTRKQHRIVGNSVSLETWVRKSHGWLLKRAKTLSEQNTLDGKPLN